MEFALMIQLGRVLGGQGGVGGWHSNYLFLSAINCLPVWAWPVIISQPKAERDSFCPDRRSWSVPGRSCHFDTGNWHSVTSAKSCHTSGFLLVHQSWLMFSTSSMMAALISKIVFFGANIRYPDIKFKCRSIFSTSGCNVSLFTLDGINPVNPLVNSCHFIM